MFKFKNFKFCYFSTISLLLLVGASSNAAPGVNIVAQKNYCDSNSLQPLCLTPEGVSEDNPTVNIIDESIIAVEDTDKGNVLWVKNNSYQLELEEKRKKYRRRIEHKYGRELQDSAAYLDSAAEPQHEPARPGVQYQPHACGSPVTDETPDGQGGCKLIFGNDSRSIVSSAQSTYPFTKFVSMTVDRYLDTTVQAGTCSGTFLDEDHVITAAHCVYNTSTNNWIYANAGNNSVRPASVNTPLGRDTGRGYVCHSGWMSDSFDFEDHCEFIETRWTVTGYINAASNSTLDAVEHDFAILKLRRDNHANGLGYGTWVAMSAIDSASTYETKLAVVQGYPAVHPPGLSFNMDDRDWSLAGFYGSIFDTIDWEIWGARQYHSHGIVDTPTTNKVLRTKLESSGGQSGSGIFYYSDDDYEYNGQSHYLIGVLFGTEVNFNNTTSDDHVVGPTVRQFRDFANNIIP